MSGLAELRQRVEAATGSEDRSYLLMLDNSIHRAVGRGPEASIGYYTTSLDAVLALVGEKLPGMLVENLGEMRDSGPLTGRWLAQLGPRGPRRRMAGPITAESLQATLDAEPLTDGATPALALLSALLAALEATPTNTPALAGSDHEERPNDRR